MTKTTKSKEEEEKKDEQIDSKQVKVAVKKQIKKIRKERRVGAEGDAEDQEPTLNVDTLRTAPQVRRNQPGPVQSAASRWATCLRAAAMGTNEKRILD